MSKLSVSILIGVLASVAVSCYPGLYRMDLQMRQPSASGYNLGGKDMGVVYLSHEKDSVIAKGIAEGLATALEEDYFGGQQAVGVYSMPYSTTADYSSRDTLLNVVMDTDKDVIFMMEIPSVDYDKLNESGALPVHIKMHVYDAMGQVDTVRNFEGVSFLKTGSLASSAQVTGQKTSAKFLSNWASETFFFYSFDTSAWSNALNAAYGFRWHEALDIWLKLAESSTGEKRSYAAFNIATTAYILGDMDLAQRWLSIIKEKGDTEVLAMLKNKIRNRLSIVTN